MPQVGWWLIGLGATLVAPAAFAAPFMLDEWFEWTPQTGDSSAFFIMPLLGYTYGMVGQIVVGSFFGLYGVFVGVPFFKLYIVAPILLALAGWLVVAIDVVGHTAKTHGR